MEQRGIVVLPEYRFKDGRLSAQFGPHLDLRLIRRYLPYWDKIDIPNNRMVVSPPPREADFLVKEGVLLKSPGNHLWRDYGNPVPDPVLSDGINTLRLHNEQESGTWTLGQTGNGWAIPGQPQDENRIVTLELHGALPLPGDSVPLETVYRFKQDRRAELEALRARLDDLCEKVVSSEDLRAATADAIRELAEAIAALNRVSSESWTTRS